MTAARLSPVDALTATVAKCRRRAATALFVRYSIATSAVALAGVAAWRFVRPDMSGVWTVLAVALGVALGAAVAARRRPPIRKVAGDIDRHLHLDDTVVAAIQVDLSAIAVGPLIVRQAVSRTGRVDPRALYPLHLRRPAAFLGASVVLLVVAMIPRSDETIARASGRGFPAGSTGAGAPAAGSAQEDKQAETQQSDGTPAGSMAKAETPDRPQGSSPTGSDSRDGRESSTAAQRADTDGGNERAESGGSTETAANGEQRGDGAAASVAGNRGTQGAAGGSARGDAGGGAGGGGSGRARAAGAGGVRGGALTPSSAPVAQATPTGAQMVQYELARRRAEAAIVRGDIPPEQRSYVREYFRAITR